ncbi:hypothetical protein CR513_41563, partial [Mucuna pruriens]
MNQSMIDATSVGALMDKTPAATRHLISNMASSTQQFGIRGAIPNKAVNKVGVVDNLRMENQLTELMSLVRQLAVSQHQQIPQVKACDICTSMEHFTDMCPTLQETKSDNAEPVGAIGGNQYGRCTFADAMLDLGASINVMPASVYKSLNFGDLEPTGVVIQLANQSVIQPIGILKDVLVQVNDLIFPIEFYVLEMEDKTLGKGSTLILAWPFLL